MPLPPESWGRVKELFEAALEEPPGSRSGYLEEHCSDPILRAEVERLLSAHDEAGSFLSSPIVRDVIAAETASCAQPETSPRQARMLSSGDVLARRFRVVRFIAEGGMGEVYEAQDEELHERVALKTIRSEILAQPNTLARFKREVQLARKVTHPNVCRIFDLFRHEPDSTAEIVFVSMELLPGKTLASELDSVSKFTPQEALPLVQQMVGGLAAAHEAGVVHRDFKPRNVMLGTSASRRRVVVTDFGLAQAIRLEESSSFSTGSGIVGTPAYMAPEQLEGRPSTPASDIYALGLVIYEMVTGDRPFHGDIPIAAALKRLSEPPTPPHVFQPDLDPLWEKVILKCLEREPSHRFAAIDQVAQVLGSQNAIEIEGKPPGVISHPPSRWRKTFLPLGVLLALVGLWLFVAHKRSANYFVRPVPGRKSIAVLGFHNTGKSDADWIAKVLTAELPSEIGVAGTFRLIPGENVARMKADLSLPDADSFASDTLNRIKTNLGTDLVVLGSYADIGERLRVDISVQETDSGETVATISESGYDREITDLVARSGTALLGKLGVSQISAVESAELRASLPSSQDTARLYAEGLSRLRLLDARGALNLLQKALDSDPDYAPAHSALAEAWGELGYDEQKKREAKRAYDLSSHLQPEAALAIEGRYWEAVNDWAKAEETYQKLFTQFPDNIEYGLSLVSAQHHSGDAKRAASTVERLHSLPVAQRDDPRIDLAEAQIAQALSDFQRALAAARRAETKARALNARIIFAQSLVEQGMALWRSGEPNKALTAFDSAKQLSEATGDHRGVALDLTLAANVRSELGDLAAAKDLYEQSLAMSRLSGYQLGTEAALNNIAIILYQQGDLSLAKKMYGEALVIDRELEDKELIASTLGNIALVNAAQGQLPLAVKAHTESANISRQIGNQSQMANELGNLAGVLYQLGELNRGQNAANEGLSAAHSIGDKSISAYVLSVLGEILLARGDLSSAETRVREALTISEELGDKSGEARGQAELAEILSELDRQEEAERLARAALGEFEMEKQLDSEISGHSILARCLLEQGKKTEARAEIEKARIKIANSQNRDVGLEFKIAAGLVSLKIGDRQSAWSQLNAAAAESKKLRFAPYEFEASLALAWLRTGNSPASVARLNFAPIEMKAREKGFVLIARKAHAYRAM